MGCSLNKCSPIDSNKSLQHSEKPSKQFLDLSDDVLLSILSFISTDQVLWNVGFVCQRLLMLSLRVIRQIELDWANTNILNTHDNFSAAIVKKEVTRLQQIYQCQEIIRCIKHVVICCNRKSNDRFMCISRDEDGRRQIFNQISWNTEQDNMKGKRFGKERIVPEIKINGKRNQNCDTTRGKILTPPKLNTETYVPELVLILHGRLSDLERYGKIKSQFDLYKMLSGLLSVHIIGCDVYHTGIKSLIEHNKGTLQGLSLLNDAELSEGAILKLVESGQYLRNLNLNGSCLAIGHLTIKSMFENCNYLECLQLNGCTNLDDEGLKIIADNCEFLIQLEIGQCSFITDTGIEVLSVSCHRMRYLFMPACVNVTDRGMKAITKNLKHLEGLNIMECDEISDESLLYLGDYCTNILHLNIGMCKNITDDGLHSFSKRCVQLQYLNIERCQNVTDSGISYVLKYCSKLRYCNLSYCIQITENVIEEIIRKHPLVTVETKFWEHIHQRGET